MNDALLEAEAINELDWRIYAPRTHRLDVYTGHGGETHGEPRLWLMDACDDYGPDADCVKVSCHDFAEWKAIHAPQREAWAAIRGTRAARVGTWKRYHEDLAFLRATIGLLGWTLTDEEHALMDALEEYGRRECAAHVRYAAYASLR